MGSGLQEHGVEHPKINIDHSNLPPQKPRAAKSTYVLSSVHGSRASGEGSLESGCSLNTDIMAGLP